MSKDAGNSGRNDVWLPDVIGIDDGTADKIEQSQESTLTREASLTHCVRVDSYLCRRP